MLANNFCLFWLRLAAVLQIYSSELLMVGSSFCDVFAGITFQCSQMVCFLKLPKLMFRLQIVFILFTANASAQ